MPIQTPLAGVAGTGPGDMFLSIRGARSGTIKGEAQDATHANEVEVLSWSWGMEGRHEFGAGSRAGRAVVHELKILKRIDSASTPLMMALRSNEVITKAVLTVRKAGKSPLEYLKITIEQGRVSSLAIEAGDGRAGTADVFENVSFTFNKISVEYTPQGKDGQALGSMIYQDEFGES